MATINPGVYTTDFLLRTLLPENVYNCLYGVEVYSDSDKKPEFMAYAFPGGYDIAYYDADDSVLCASCATKQIISQLEEIDECFADEREYHDTYDTFRIVAAECTDCWEENELCAGCNKSIGPECEDSDEE